MLDFLLTNIISPIAVGLILLAIDKWLDE
ncbi:type I toxin-antitoxin system Fst family toxin [Streptococcus suis]